MRDIQLSPVNDVDNLIHNLVPCLLEAAGMIKEASEMRLLPTIIGGPPAVALNRAFLKRLSSTKITPSRDAHWLKVIEEVAFWSEAAIVTAVNGAEGDCLACVWFIKRIMDVTWCKYQEH